MMSYAPYKAVKGCSAEIPEIRSAAATMVLKWDGSFAARVAKIRLNALSWIAVADSELSPTVPEPRPRSADEDDADEEALELLVASIEVATTCILRGVQIAHSASILLRSQLVAHRGLGLTYDPEHMASRGCRWHGSTLG
jgi:lysozyme family protein